MGIKAGMYEDKKELLADLISKKVSRSVISQETGIPKNTIPYYMRKWGISKPQVEFVPAKRTKYDHLKEIAKDMCSTGMNTYDIADKLGIPRGSIAYILKSWGMNKITEEARGGHFSAAGRASVNSAVKDMHGQGKKHPLAGLVALRGRLVTPAERLEAIKECIEKDMTYNEMAEALQLSKATFWKVMKDNGMLRGARKKERSRNWCGGHAKFRGSGWQQQRKLCLQRDGYKCRDCGKTNAQELKDLGRQLSAHHIDPYRKSNDSSLDNLITVCQSCHMKREHKEGTFVDMYFKSPVDIMRNP